ncbi:hypothetical protein EON66_06885 [archaeon]|nr:MAG: hypothetical protein EON66_06885 [archaeon]
MCPLRFILALLSTALLAVCSLALLWQDVPPHPPADDAPTTPGCDAKEAAATARAGHASRSEAVYARLRAAGSIWRGVSTLFTGELLYAFLRPTQQHGAHKQP